MNIAKVLIPKHLALRCLCYSTNMKIETKQKGSLIAIVLSLIILALANIVGFGKYLAVVLPCTTNPQDSMYCYSGYDMALYVILGLVITVCVVGLGIDLFRSIVRRR